MDNEELNPNYELSPEAIVHELRESFKEEANEHLSELEHGLLELEKTPDDKQQVERVFRAMHTLKGSSGACQFDDIVAFTHELETIFDLVRNKKVVVSREIINLTLLARDHLRTLFNRHYEGTPADDARTNKILMSFKGLVRSEMDQRNATPVEGHGVPSKESEARRLTYRIRFHPDAKVFRTGTDLVSVLNELRELGTSKIVVQADAIPNLEDIDPSACYIFWDIILTTSRSINAIQDVFILIKDHCAIKIDVIDEETYVDDDKTYKNLGEILLERGDLVSDDLQKILKDKKKVGEILVESGVISSAKVESALLEQQHIREVREQRKAADSMMSIRVPTEKLDSLVNLVGELVTVQARLSQTTATTNQPELLSIAEEVERLTANLRDSAMNIRMLPIGVTFNKFKRVVRDLSAELGKEIELTTEGAETELDKTVIERLGDPLVHIIRNSIGHGIEDPESRMAGGKPRKGMIRLSAFHSGAHVLIRVEDDGIGLDKDAIREKAIEKGLLSPDATLPEKELFALIFAAGFSTAKEVTDISGRGVGLDVVKKAIDNLHGSVEIDSSRGFGTTITLKLPLTLAIIDGLLVKIEKQHFVLPLSFVKECVELTALDRRNARNRQIAYVRGEIVPYINLRELFEIGGDAPSIEQIVLTEINGHRVGFVVDSVIGSLQTVIKSLSSFYQGAEEISGATILGDGTVAMILDVPRLMRVVEQREAQLTKK